MTLYEFNALPDDRQVALVFDQARFLATRWEEEDAVVRYELPGVRLWKFSTIPMPTKLPGCGLLPIRLSWKTTSWAFHYPGGGDG